MLPDHIEQACDMIDAVLFTGTSFYDNTNLKELRNYLKRWEKEMQSIERAMEHFEEVAHADTS